MKLIIDIDENLFTRLFDNGVELSPEDAEKLATIVRNGKPCANQPKAKWIIQSTGDMTNYFICSRCHKAGDGWDSFCRRCGAQMDVKEAKN